MGCGQPTGYVTGKVTYQGRPLTSGAVTFHGEDGRVDSGPINSEGNYVVANAPSGTVKVTVVVRQVNQKAVSKRGPGAKSPTHPDQAKQPPAETAKPLIIPPRFADPNQSGLAYNVTGGKQTIDIPLE
jgi:hypothetical protein